MRLNNPKLPPLPNINKKFPLTIKELESIINKIHCKYPLLDKSDISIIVRTFFDIIRELLLQGKTISINNLFSHMKIISYARINKRKKKIVITPSIKITTSDKMKKW